MQTFYYKNTLGFHKMLEIAEVPKQDGTYHCRLWCANNGELCGYNDLSLEEIEQYFINNHIDGTFVPRLPDESKQETN